MKVGLAVFIFSLLYNPLAAQDALYPNAFPLGDVKLSAGPFKHACELNIETLLQYDVDRLVAPFRKQAELPQKAACFENWDGLNGHVGGHYLSALAIHYAATGNAECKRRMDGMIAELLACQHAHAEVHPTWGIGYVGGVPKSRDIWPAFKQGDFAAFRQSWVPWYNLHKLYAGLRDAWLYGGNETAKSMFLKFCDWGISITAGLTAAQMDSVLAIEHGGMNEIFADAYQMTGDETYLIAAKRFSHKQLLDAMAAGIDNLDNKHANTQVPKAVGFQRIAELAADSTYAAAARFFWETVTQNRTLAFGGNSRREHFPPDSACDDYVKAVQGPESCNTYNMLKLTESLFRARPDVRYVDFYERALYNHTLSTQHPKHGGYVYFTPARPRHYRVYSAPNQAMWCCVGTGMENHGKYGQFIYAHQQDTLFINLFIPSELTWREKGIKIKQETNFPFQEDTRLTITEGEADFKLMIRYPSWVAAGALTIHVNGKMMNVDAFPGSFVPIIKKWEIGDVIDIHLPMHTRTESLPHVPDYIAFLHGPILLAAKSGADSLTGLVADAGRWAHIAPGPRYPLHEAPVIVTSEPSVLGEMLQPVPGRPLHFKAPSLKMINPLDELVFEPFGGIHDSRYVMYWKIAAP